MSDRPIIFSAPMVRALLAGRKTQTRRLATSPLRRCAPGERLRVREAWRPNYVSEGWREDLGRVAKPSDFDPASTVIEYLADGERELGVRDRPGMDMPRWASRLTLIVEDVRVEPLQAISEEDAIAEWIELHSLAGASGWTDYGDKPGDMTRRYFADPRRSFRSLWQLLHGEGAWDAYPYVVALTFHVAHENIDRIVA